MYFYLDIKYPENFIQSEFSKLRSHRGLCQLSHCILRVLDSVTGLEKEIELTKDKNKLSIKSYRCISGRTLKGSSILRYRTPSICSVTLSDETENIDELR